MVERHEERHGTAGSGAGGEKGMKQQASEAAGQVKDRAAQLTDQVAGQATTMLDERKDQATGGLGQVAQVARQTGDELRSRDQDMLAGYIEQAADRLEFATTYLRNRDVRDLIGDVESFARREPTLFLGGAFAVGLLAARFLKSSGSANGSGNLEGQRQGQGETRAGRMAHPGYAIAPRGAAPTTRPGETRQPSTASEGALRGPTAGAASFPTPVGDDSPVEAGTGGIHSVGTGGSLDPTRPGGTTSTRSGAPDWQAGGTERGNRDDLDPETRATPGSSPSGRSDVRPASGRSGGDAGA